MKADTPTPQPTPGRKSMWGEIAEIIAPQLEQDAQRTRFFDDPVAWGEYMLGVQLWSIQGEIARAVTTDKQVAVAAGHDVGKTWLTAFLSCWWVDTRYPDVFVLSTAPSFPQVNNNIWHEIRMMHKSIKARYARGEIDHELPGYITSKAQWNMPDGQRLGEGRAPRKEEEGDSIVGLHRRYVLAIGDEAVGLTEPLLEAMGSVTSNATSRLVLVCNPTNPTSFVGKQFQNENPKWRRFNVSVFDSPNFTDEKDALLPNGERKFPPDVLDKFVDQSYVENMKAYPGEDTAAYKARVLGQFSFDTDEVFFDPTLIMQAVKEPDPTPELWDIVVLGVDVAGSGGDKSVIYHRHGNRLSLLDTRGGNHTKVNHKETVEWIDRHAREQGATQVRIDAVGMGDVIAQYVANKSDGAYEVIGMIGNAAVPPDKKFVWYNSRAMWYDEFRRAFVNEEVAINPDTINPEISAKDAYQWLHDDLTTIRYSYAGAREALLLESKKDMKKRDKASPDFADAAVYAWFRFQDEEEKIDNRHKQGDVLAGDAFTPEELMYDPVRMYQW